MSIAPAFMDMEPITVTASRAERSQGGKHDFYSEGDYWWPNPKDPDGPYIRRDGASNPDNFLDHRKAMIRLTDIVGATTSAYLLTKDEKYAEEAVKHIKAWFVDEDTRMAPRLLYAQAIKGRHTGRSIGLIDTLHIVEVALAAKSLFGTKAMAPYEKTVKQWFSTYMNWMNTHPYGLEEKVHPNNHGASWSLQVSAFARVTGEGDILNWVENQFKHVYLHEMMNKQGGFDDELARTKPYGYSLFMIDVMSALAQVLYLEGRDVWHYETDSNRSMQLGLSFIYPYVVDKGAWPYQQDILYWDEWPVRHGSLLFAGIHFSEPEYIETWAKLESDPTVLEVKRNLPIRHPLLWVEWPR